jgi:hypothetical protein
MAHPCVLSCSGGIACQIKEDAVRASSQKKALQQQRGSA